MPTGPLQPQSPTVGSSGLARVLPLLGVQGEDIVSSQNDLGVTTVTVNLEQCHETLCIIVVWGT